MPSSPGAIPRPGRPGAFAPEPTRAGAPADAAGRPQLGPGLEDAPTEVAGPASEPPPSIGALPAGRDEADSLPPPPPRGGPVEAFAEFEGDAIAGESTRIEDRDALAEESTGILEDAPKLPFLFVEAGKDQGREYVLQEGETSIGRGIDNDVILADVSVSRRHFRIQREGGAITLRDLGSGNGTQVNGRRAHVEVLSDGDRIELGETVLVLRVPGGELRPDAQGATHETVAPISGGVPVAPSGGFATPSPGPTLPPVGASTDELVSPRDGRTQSIVLPRRALFLAAAAVAIVGSVIGAGVVSLMAREPETVATSVPPRTAVVSVPGAPTSLPAVGTVPTPAPTPPVGPTPGLAPAPGLAPVPVAPVAAPTPVPTPAPVPPPVAVTPTPVPAPTPPVVAPTVAAVPEPEVVDEEPAGRPGGRRRTGGGSTASSGGSTGGASGGGGRSAAVAAFRSGDFSGAARLAREAARGASARDRGALERLAGEIDDFARLHRTIQAAGTSYGRVGASDAARAIRLDRSIGGGGHTRAFAAGYVDWLLDQAESSFSGDPAGACRQARSAGDIDASARSRALGERCAERARSMLAEASRAERTDPARARDLYRAILRMVPGTAEATDAQRRVDALGRTRIVDEDE